MKRILRASLKILALTGVVVGGSFGVWEYQSRHADSAKIARLEQEKEALHQVVKRLSEETRMAEMLVTKQEVDSSGELRTNLLFVEYTRAGESLPPKMFTIVGKQAHIDAMVIKFDQHFVEDGDALRGHSIALFTKLYGDQQSPKDAASIDEPGKIPDVFRDVDPQIVTFEQNLWKDFWKLAGDENYRKEKGVRVAMGQGVWGMFEPEKLYRITLESNGGLNLTAQPLRGIYREAIKNNH